MRASTSRKRGAASSSALLAIFVFIAGIAVGIGAVKFRRNRPEPASESPATLSESARAVVQGLNSPVEIRYYSLLDPATTAEPLHSFADRVEALLEEFSRESADKIRFTRAKAPSDQAAKDASSDGIQPFNIEKGDACFLGLAISQNDRKETLPRLSPDWEGALEADIARAIERLSAPTPAPTSTQAVAAQKSSLEKVKNAIPNLDSLSLENAKRLLQEKAVGEFKAAAADLAAQVKQAQERLDKAQREGTEADQQQAMKELQDLQSAQTERMKNISMDLQEQIAALESLKKKQ